MFELLTGKDPWEDIESLVDLVDAVCMERRRPPLPKDLPTSLKELINKCWHPDPDKRPAFEEIVPRFDEIIIDSLLKDPNARQMWRKNFLGKVKVTWPEFVKALMAELRVPIPKDPLDIKMQCLRAVLGKKEDKDQKIVTIESLSALLDWFGPMENATILDRIYNLLAQPYFFGDISAQEAEKLVTFDKKKFGTFILRFSTHDPGCYALTVHSATGLKHYRVSHKPGQPYSIGKIECPTLEELLKKYGKELELKTPCAGSPTYALVYGSLNHVDSKGYTSVEF